MRSPFLYAAVAAAAAAVSSSSSSSSSSTSLFADAAQASLRAQVADHQQSLVAASLELELGAGVGLQHHVSVLNLAGTEGYIKYDKSALDNGAAGYVVKGKVYTTRKKTNARSWASDHTVHASHSSTIMLDDLVTDHGGETIIVKAALQGADAMLLAEAEVNECLRSKMNPLEYSRYVAEYYGRYYTQCVKANAKKRIKTVGTATAVATALDDQHTPLAAATALPQGVCMYLAFEFANPYTLKKYLGKMSAGFREKFDFLTAISKAFMALWKTGFAHGDAHWENLLVDKYGRNPKWIDLSGMTVIKPKPTVGNDFGGVCQSTRDHISKNPSRTVDTAWTVAAGSATAPKDFFGLWQHWDRLKTGDDENCLDYVAQQIRTALEAVEAQRIRKVMGQTHTFPATWDDLTDMLDSVFEDAVSGAQHLLQKNQCDFLTAKARRRLRAPPRTRRRFGFI